jgi:hypothetical protein
MRNTLVLPAAVAGALAACLALFRGGVALTDTLADCARKERFGDRLDGRLTAIHDKSEGRRRVATEVIAGRLALQEAAEWFGRLDDEAGEVRGALPRTAPGERQSRDVLVYITTALLGDESEQAVAVRARLTTEFQERFHHPPNLP